MIRAVGNKRLDLNDAEYRYYLQIREAVGERDFVGLFETDKNGLITGIMPQVGQRINIMVIYFILNVMVNQRVRILEGSIKKVENFIDQIGAAPNILERLERLEKRLEKQ